MFTVNDKIEVGQGAQGFFIIVLKVAVLNGEK